MPVTGLFLELGERQQTKERIPFVKLHEPIGMLGLFTGAWVTLRQLPHQKSPTPAWMTHEKLLTGPIVFLLQATMRRALGRTS